jgi:hypothetical protein
VDVDLSADLPLELVVKRKNGETVVQGVDYEKLPDLCSHCSNIGHHVSTCKYVNPSPPLVGEQKRNGRGRSRQRRPKKDRKVFVKKPENEAKEKLDTGKTIIVDTTPSPLLEDAREGPSFIRKSSSPTVRNVVSDLAQPITDHHVVGVEQPGPINLQPVEPLALEKNRNNLPLIVHNEELNHNEDGEIADDNGLARDDNAISTDSGTVIPDSETDSGFSPIRNVSSVPINSWYDEVEGEPEFTEVISKNQRKSSRKATHVENREAYIRRSKIISQ